jgi:hypothetical protein
MISFRSSIFMRFSLTWHLVSCQIVTSFVFLGCSSAEKVIAPSSLKGDLKSSTDDPRVAEALKFRALFNRLLGKMSKQEFSRLSFSPESTLVHAPQSSLGDIESFFRKFTPEYFYKRSTGPDSNEFNEKRFLRKLHFHDAPITLIVMPGFSSEFAYGPAFTEAVSNEESSFSRLVRLRMSKKEKVYDQRYSLSHLGYIKVPLEDLVRFGSIDDSDGQAIVNVIFLHPELGSLETFGRLEDLYPTYKRRLDKFFDIIGNQKNIFISGHSRGAAIALDFIAKSFDGNTPAKSAHDWVKEVKGFVGFNGALYGSHYAEAYFNKRRDPYIFRVNFGQMKSLREDISIADSITNRNIILGNLIDMGIEIMFRADVEKEETSFNLPDITLGIKRYGQAREMFSADAVLLGYPDHIQKVKKFAQEMDAAIHNLKHVERLSWWQKHELPTHLKYFTLSATLPGPIIKNNESPWRMSLLQAPSMGRQDLDYHLFRRFYYDYYEQSKISLNDGLVGVHESTIWTKLHQRLNPRQKPYESNFLGLFATHHTAMVYGLLTTDDYEDRNPFPRRALLAALGYYLKIDRGTQKPGKESKIVSLND